MTLRHFQIFKAVCSEESITLAAEKMNMTQPAVSIAIKELESFYNVKLFERMSRRIFITEAGHCLLQYANTVLSQFEESVDVIRDAGKFNKCCFGTNVTIGETCLSSLMTKISCDLPHLSVNVIVRNSHEIEKMLLRNDIDFAVVDNITAESNFNVTPLFTDRMAVACSKNYNVKDELTLNELSVQKLLLREKGSCARTCIDSVFQAESLTVIPIIESVSTMCLLDCARKGLGITIVPEALVENDINKGNLKRLTIENTVFERDYFVICHKNKFLTSCMNSVIDLIKSEIK